MKTTVETITPKKAAAWLKRNVNNRPLSTVFADQLAQAMTDGEWRVNGDAIRFDLSGDLIDGQHRLEACVRSGVSVQSLVVRGIESKSFDTIDRGHRRNNGHVLARRGEKHYNILASLCSLVWRYIGDQPIECGSKAPRPDQLDTLMGLHGDDLRLAASFAALLKSPLLPPSETAFMVFCGRRIWGGTATDEFWTAVLTADGLKGGSPAHVLHRRLIESIQGNTRLRKKSRIAMCIKAFNAHMTGQRIRCLKYTEGEDMPLFVTSGKKGDVL